MISFPTAHHSSDEWIHILMQVVFLATYLTCFKSFPLKDSIRLTRFDIRNMRWLAVKFSSPQILYFESKFNTNLLFTGIYICVLSPIWSIPLAATAQKKQPRQTLDYHHNCLCWQYNIATRMNEFYKYSLCETRRGSAQLNFYVSDQISLNPFWVICDITTWICEHWSTMDDKQYTLRAVLKADRSWK